MSVLARLAASAVSRSSLPPKEARPRVERSPAQKAIVAELQEFLPAIGKAALLFGATAEGLIATFIGDDPVAVHGKLVEFIAKAQAALEEDHAQRICGCQQCAGAAQGVEKSAPGENGEREEHA